MFPPLFLSLYLSIYVYIYIHIYLSQCLSISLFVRVGLSHVGFKVVGSNSKPHFRAKPCAGCRAQPKTLI